MYSIYTFINKEKLCRWSSYLFTHEIKKSDNIEKIFEE